MTLEAVYFDLDGTLVDSEHLHAVSWNKVLQDYNVQYSEDEFCMAFAGKPTLEAANVIVNTHKLKVSPSQLAEQKHQVFAAVSQQALPRLLPGASEILEWCKQQGLKLALVTGSAKAEAHSILNGHQLYNFFDVIFTRDDVVAPKPHPEPYLSAISALNSNACEGVAIEDTVTGSTSAVEAGLSTIVVSSQYSKEHDFSHVQHQCDSLIQVIDVIKSKL